MTKDGWGCSAVLAPLLWSASRGGRLVLGVASFPLVPLPIAQDPLLPPPSSSSSCRLSRLPPQHRGHRGLAARALPRGRRSRHCSPVSYAPSGPEDPQTDRVVAGLREHLYQHRGSPDAQCLNDPLRILQGPQRKEGVAGEPPDLVRPTHLYPQLFETEMDNFFSLFRRYLNDKAKGTTV